jgi:transketolase
MREVLSQLLTQRSVNDKNAVVLSGDHGYALFDQIRSTCPDQFINAGLIEQAMVGIAAGMAKMGFKPIVYGLAAFVPIRVLEQIKLDVSFPGLPVIFLGDGAGIVYSALGSSHHCAEDIACMMTLPKMRVYFPCDQYELEACFKECLEYNGPSYLRIGKADRPVVNKGPLKSTAPYFTHKSGAKTCLVSTGSMVSIAHELAKEFGYDHLSVPCLKPLDSGLPTLLTKYSRLMTFEEHHRHGGMTSAITDLFCDQGVAIPPLRAFTLGDKFSDKCGGYQFALSEHGISDEQLRNELRRLQAEL